MYLYKMGDTALVKIYLAQMEPVLNNKELNIEKIHYFIKESSNQNANLVLFPELALTGLSTKERTRELAECSEGPNVKKVQYWAEKYRVKIIFGFPELKDNKVFNSACFINDDGELLGIHRKAHLWDEEEKYYSPGNSFTVWDTDIGKIGIMICFDSQFPESARLLALQGADMIMVPTGNMSPFESFQPFNIQSRAEENQLFICTTNLVGTEDSLYFFGESTAADPNGKMLVKADQSESGIVVNIDLQTVLEVRGKYNYIASRRPDLYNGLLNDI